MDDTEATGEAPTPSDDLSGVATAAKALADAVRFEVGKAVRGQEDVIETALIALLAGGHALFEGVPGTAKTLLVRTLAAACQAQFKRIQFTPDLMPSDIVGTNVFEASSAEFRLRQGPVFTEFLLADEINRTPPKTQAALLEAMEERRVSIDGESLPLPPIFTVFATQNPVEFEGTYPLPEAQVDRFLVKVLIDYPDEAAENEMLSAWDSGFQARDLATANVQPVASVADILAIRASLPRVKIEEKTRAYIISLVRATRQHKQLLLGASPRASVALLLASKTRALLQGRDYVNPDDIKAMSLPVLRHRVLLRPEAELEGIGPDRILTTLVASVEVPR